MTKATKIVVAQLDVGQGASTFVESDRGTKIVATALFDLGSERARSEAGGPSVDYIETKLKSMTAPKIDFFSLSHSDSDHINLVQALLRRFDPPGTSNPTKPILEVGKVVFGGPRRKYVKHSGNNVIAELERYQTGDTPKPEPLSANSCSFSTNTPMFKINGVEFFLLVGNHLRGKAKDYSEEIENKKWRVDGYSLNTYSLIFVVIYDDWRYVITGDATAATIVEANYLIEKYEVTFANVAVLTMPHHSSETTTFSLTGRKSRRGGKAERVSEEAKEVIETFADTLKPMSIHASAEEVGSFRHPSAYVMSYFWDYVLKDGWYVDPVLKGKRHFYNAYFEEEDGFSIKFGNKKKMEDLPPFNDWWTFATDYAVFTNRYYVRDKAYDPDKNQTAILPPDPARLIDIPKPGASNSPPFAVAWAYESVNADNQTYVERLTNRQVGDNDFETARVFSFAKGEAPIERTDAVEAVPAPRRQGAPSVDLAPLKPPSHRPEPAGRPLRRMRPLDG